MKTEKIMALFLALSCISLAALKAPAQETAQPSDAENFSAVAYLPSGAGRRMLGAGNTFNVDIHVNNYSSDENAKVLAAALLEGGSDAVLKSLEKMDSIGRINLTGRLGFYDLKFIRSHKTKEGRRIVAVTDRPISGLEVVSGSASEGYKFGILILDVKPNKKGREEGAGTLIYAAKIKLISSSTVEIENYGVSPIQLRGVRKL